LVLDLGDLINRFEFFIGIEFIIEVNEVCSGTPLAMVQTVLSEVSCLPTFKAGIVGRATRGSSSSCVRPELATSLALSVPVSIRGTGTI